MRKFTHINEEFRCAHCGRQVPKRQRSCRNHCPFCLTSCHVDLNPGDRAAGCGGLMPAIGYEGNLTKGIVLIFRCLKCGFQGRNIAALDDPIAPDDYDQILKLTPPR